MVVEYPLGIYCKCLYQNNQIIFKGVFTVKLYHKGVYYNTVVKAFPNLAVLQKPAQDYIYIYLQSLSLDMLTPVPYPIFEASTITVILGRSTFWLFNEQQLGLSYNITHEESRFSRSVWKRNLPYREGLVDIAFCHSTSGDISGFWRCSFEASLRNIFITNILFLFFYPKDKWRSCILF